MRANPSVFLVLIPNDIVDIKNIVPNALCHIAGVTCLSFLSFSSTEVTELSDAFASPLRYLRYFTSMN